MTNSRESKESVIREKRTIEATQKDLMGPTGKIGVILKTFGSLILRHNCGGGLHDVGYLDDYYDDSSEIAYEKTASGQDGPIVGGDQIETIGDDDVEKEGMFFDGLSRGMHLEIIHHDPTNEIKVTYKGFVVYREIAGELETYAPFPEWESLIERLYAAAKPKYKEKRKASDESFREQVDREKRGFWQDLRLRWGL